MSAQAVCMLGPQRLAPNVKDAVKAAGVKGRLAVITAGWEERELEDQELSEHLSGRTLNLKLYTRAEDVIDRAPERYAVLRERNDRHRELQELYRLRLSYALGAARELFAREGDADLLDPARDAAIDSVRRLDAHHLERVAELEAETLARLDLENCEPVQEHRREILKDLETADGVCIAGGHVRILKHRIQVFGLESVLADRPLFVWSAGAMALSERIVLFHDHPPQGSGDAEVFGPGLGLLRDVVPLPDAAQRLRLKDRTRVSIFARRFAPALAVALDSGSFFEHGAGGKWRARRKGNRLAETGELVEVPA